MVKIVSVKEGLSQKEISTVAYITLENVQSDGIYIFVWENLSVQFKFVLIQVL